MMNQPHTGWRIPLLFIALTLIVNGLIFALGWNQDGASRVRIAPPGWVIGVVWIVLLGLLGFAHTRLQRPGSAAATARRGVWGLLGLCLAYPLYTGGFSSDIAALIGNFVVLAWAGITVVLAAPVDRIAAFLIVPMLLWIGYANAIVGAALA